MIVTKYLQAFQVKYLIKVSGEDLILKSFNFRSRYRVFCSVVFIWKYDKRENDKNNNKTR